METITVTESKKPQTKYIVYGIYNHWSPLDPGQQVLSLCQTYSVLPSENLTLSHFIVLQMFFEQFFPALILYPKSYNDKAKHICINFHKCIEIRIRES